jgi:hypothetical protein
MDMATLRLKARTMPAAAKSEQATATTHPAGSPKETGQVRKAAGTSQASAGSLREYLKTNH